MPPSEPPAETRAEACLRIFGRDPGLCPTCGKGRLVVVDRWYVAPVPTNVVIDRMLGMRL